MPTQPEAPAVLAGRERTIRGAAFGLSLEVDPRIDIPGVSRADAPGDPALAHPVQATPFPAIQPPTRVLLDPGELRRRWSPVERTSELVRELRDGDAVLLDVQLAPAVGYLLHAPGFARILVTSDGTELLCDPESEPERAEWSTLLPAQALPLAATLRGLEVLHASGVVLGDAAPGSAPGSGAVLFAGPQGAGKSSLAAALLHRGAALLSDDTVALESREDSLIAHPGTSSLHLRANEHRRLSSRERAVLGPTATVLGKQRYATTAAASPAPFGALFMLERSRRGPPVEWIEAVDPFALLASTFNLSVRTPERLTRHLDLAAALAASGHIYRLRIQPGVDASRLADTLCERLPEL